MILLHNGRGVTDHLTATANRLRAIVGDKKTSYARGNQGTFERVWGLPLLSTSLSPVPMHGEEKAFSNRGSRGRNLSQVK